MITDKPTPEQLVTFLKGLSDDELDELLVTRAHHNNTVPIEFVSKSTGTSCGIDNDGMQLAMRERVGRSNTVLEELGLKARTPIPDGGKGVYYHYTPLETVYSPVKKLLW